MVSLLKLVKINKRSAGKTDHLDFLPPVHGVLASPPSVFGVRLTWVICVIVTVLLASMWFGRVDVYAVAEGRIEPVGRSKIVQPRDEERVVQVFVHNGSHVTKGQPLVLLDSVSAKADLDAQRDQFTNLSCEVLRRRFALAVVAQRRFSPIPSLTYPAGADPDCVERERLAYQADLADLQSNVELIHAKIQENDAKKATLQAQISAHQHLIATLEQRVAMRDGLARQGWDSLSSVLDAREDLGKELSSLASEKGSLTETDASTKTLQRQITETYDKFSVDYTTALLSAEDKIADAETEIKKGESKVEDTQLKAPISGAVQDLSVTTMGQVVAAGQQLMTIVPEGGGLQVEALVQNADVGFVRVGQEATIKVDSFPFTRYGTLAGTVKTVSRDSVSVQEAQNEGEARNQRMFDQGSATASTPRTAPLVYPIFIALSQDWMMVDRRRQPLSPGMQVTAEVSVGRRRILEYLLSPIVEVLADAGHER